MFSTRVPLDRETNALTRAVDALRANGGTIVDLTESNPTRADIPYPGDLLDPFRDDRALRYEPQPLGLPEARAAVAADCGRRQAGVSAEQVVLTASTSEAYSWLFKLLCDPGDAVLVPRPSYPLFDHLTRLEGVETQPYDLEYHAGWSIDLPSVAAGDPRTRALVLVSPNNPTGSYVKPAELDGLLAIARTRDWAIIADEVFADYALETAAPLTDLAQRSDVLAFTLGGLSKTVGLPQMKLGWIVVGGPAALRGRAIQSLELIADSFLSVSTPVQLAVGSLLAGGGVVRAAIHDRVTRNLSALRTAARPFPSCEVLTVEGGWTAVLRIPATRDEEDVVLDLLASERILVHPGYFFDFPREAYLVVSLLPPEAVFAEAVARVLRFVTR